MEPAGSLMTSCIALSCAQQIRAENNEMQMAYDLWRDKVTWNLIPSRASVKVLLWTTTFYFFRHYVLTVMFPLCFLLSYKYLSEEAAWSGLGRTGPHRNAAIQAPPMRRKRRPATKTVCTADSCEHIRLCEIFWWTKNYILWHHISRLYTWLDLSN